MTMNMPTNYQLPNRYQQPSYPVQNSYSVGGMVNQSRQPVQFSSGIPITPNMQGGRAINPNITRQFNPSQSSNQIPVQSRRNLPTNGQFVNRTMGPQYDEFSPSQNAFMRPPIQGPQQRYVSPVGQPVYSPQEMYPNYQQPYQNYYSPQPQIYQQPYPNSYPPSSYQPNMAQNYIPLYTSPYQNYELMMGQTNQLRNLPQQSINSNFNYQNANFDCNYQVQQNMVHCVICNQTYKANQKKQHLQLHRQKARNVNIRAVDEQQLKRLDKYNSMIKPSGLIVKPIVQPDEFNVQYNPNEFVLRKVTQYKDTDIPNKNTIQIQTDDPHALNYSRPQDLGFNSNQSRRSGNSSPQRRSQQQQQQQQQQSIRRSDSPGIAQNARNTNTRFNSESIRQQQKIFLSDRFDHQQPEGQTFNSNYNPDNNPMRDSSKRGSNANEKLGYSGTPSFKSKNAESVNKASELGYDNGLHEIEEEEYRKEGNDKEIAINKIVNDVNRGSQY